jgi:hypothetical protein
MYIEFTVVPDVTLTAKGVAKTAGEPSRTATPNIKTTRGRRTSETCNEVQGICGILSIGTVNWQVEKG